MVQDVNILTCKGVVRTNWQDGGVQSQIDVVGIVEYTKKENKVWKLLVWSLSNNYLMIIPKETVTSGIWEAMLHWKRIVDAIFEVKKFFMSQMNPNDIIE